MTLPFGLDLAGLLTSGQYSDMTLVCDGREFKVHKLVVCSLSPVLASAMKEPFEEAQTGVLHVKDFDTHTVEQMLQFLYTGDYTVSQAPQNGTAPLPAQEGEEADAHIHPLDTDWVLSQHIRVNAIADYYNIQTLAEKSTANIRNAVQAHGDPATVMEAASFAVQRTGDSGMLSAMAEAVSGHLGPVLADDKHASTLADLVNDFGVAVLRHRAEEQKAQVAMMEKLEKSLRASEAKCGRLIENFENCRVRLETLTRCTNISHCQTQFGCVIDKTGQPWEPRYTVRCASCARRYA